MTAMLIELSAEATTGPPRADATAMAAATAATRRLSKACPSWVAFWTQANAHDDPRWPSGLVPNTGGAHGEKTPAIPFRATTAVTASGRSVPPRIQYG